MPVLQEKKSFFSEGGFHRAILLWARAVVDLAIFSGRVSKSRIGNFGYLDVFHAPIPKKQSPRRVPLGQFSFGPVDLCT